MDTVIDHDPARVYLRNLFITLVKIGVYTASGIFLPAYLARHLPSQTYGGWILVLQLANCLTYLDLGIQNAIAKYVAEFTSRLDSIRRDQYASTGTAIMLVIVACGIFLNIGLALLVPYLFQDMPADIAADVKHGLLLVGASTVILLGASPFAAFFLGLQRYTVPTVISISNRSLFVIAILVMVEKQRSLTEMGAAVATINLLTALTQIIAWRTLLREIRVDIHSVVWNVGKKILAYCAVLGIWTSGMLVITGLDTTIVGHYDFEATAYYAVAAIPINFLGLILQAALNPFMPAVSALSALRTSEELGSLLARSTRYVTLALVLCGLPLFLFGFPLLYLWAGPAFGQNGFVLLRLLVIAHIVRNICGPYATMVIATGRQRAATLSGICEAVANFSFSVLLAKYYGAAGVAAGTLIGAVVGVVVHFLISIPGTQETFSISAKTLFATGVMRPGLVILPALVILPLIWRPTFSEYTLALGVAWFIASACLGWYAALTRSDRTWIVQRLAIERAVAGGG